MLNHHALPPRKALPLFLRSTPIGLTKFSAGTVQANLLTFKEKRRSPHEYHQGKLNTNE